MKIVNCLDNLIMLIQGTPIESYQLKGREILVKREDLCCAPPGPPFSKVRGLWEHMLRLKQDGIDTLGYVETSVSMAGWAIAWAGQRLGFRVVIYDPQYKVTPDLLAYHREQWKAFDAILEPIPAGMARVNFNICRNKFREKYGNRARMLPLGLILPEAIDTTASELKMSLRHNKVEINHIVVNVGSGTIAAGILRGVTDLKLPVTIHGVMGRTGDIGRKERLIRNKAVFFLSPARLQLYDPGWEYTEACDIELPFPSHRFYDTKAASWMLENLDQLDGTILFWNIGASPI